MEDELIYIVIIAVIAAVITGVAIHFSIRRTPQDTDLWGPMAPLWDCNPDERPGIIMRHPELLDIVKKYGLFTAFPDCGPDTTKKLISGYPELQKYLPRDNHKPDKKQPQP